MVSPTRSSSLLPERIDGGSTLVRVRVRVRIRARVRVRVSSQSYTVSQPVVLRRVWGPTRLATWRYC